MSHASLVSDEKTEQGIPISEITKPFPSVTRDPRSLQIYLVTTYSMPGTIPDTREIAMNGNAYPCTAAHDSSHKILEIH